MFEIRAAKPHDADALGEIHAISWEAAYAPRFAAEFASQAVESRRTR